MGFWGDTWDAISDYAETAAVAIPGSNLVMALTDEEQRKQLASDAVGLARTAAVVVPGAAAFEIWNDPVLREQAEREAAEFKETLEKKGGQLLSVLDFITNPWALAGAAVLVGLVVAAPYVAPLIKRS